MKPKSDNLFHFTKSLDVLKLILKHGIQPRYCLEDVEWFGFDDHKYIAFPMCCFCDIPLSRISEHTDFYGSFGLGLTKEWGAKNGLNPVVYSPEGGIVQDLMKFMFYLDHDSFEESIQEGMYHHSYRLWSLLKPTKGKMVVSGSIVEKDFYQESEWRFVPPGRELLTQNTYKEDKEKANTEVFKYTLQLSPCDIKYIFVRSDSDIPELVDFINTQLGNFPLNDLKILQSRIVSLDTLASDL